MKEDLVTVVIPTHRGCEKIHKTVSSALKQSYINLEVIVVDDNGKGCEEQIKTEKALSPLLSDGRLTYVVHDVGRNGAAARNTAMKMSRGRYIAFLDDDDEYKPECIEKEVEAFNRLSDDYGIVFVSFLQIREGMKDKVVISSFDGDVLEDFLLGRIESPSSVVMIKREVMETVGLWDESFCRHQDWEYFARIMYRYKAYGITDVLVLRPVLERHSAKNPNLYEQQRMHYLNKMSEIIESCLKDVQKAIYDRHYRDISKAYLKNKKFVMCIRWTFKTSQPIKNTLLLFSDALSYLKNAVN